MKYNRLTRRQFLQGAGGAFLALPFLPSLMSKAEAQSLTNPKFFVTFWSGHGGVNVQNRFPIVSNPAVSSQFTTSTMYSANNHTVRSANLSSLLTTKASNLSYLASNLDGTVKSQGGNIVDPAAYDIDPNGVEFDAGLTRVSPIIGNFANANLGKMTLIAGLDLMYYGGHCYATTGNFNGGTGLNPTDGTPYFNLDGNSIQHNITNPDGSDKRMTNYWIPSLDMMAAYAPNFYASSPRFRSVMINTDYGAGEDDGGQLSCLGLGTASTNNSANYGQLGSLVHDLFNGITSTGGASVANNKKDFVLNKVYADYVRVARGAHGPGRRIGQDDRNVFEQFMANIASILNTVTSVGVCTVPTGIASNDQREVRGGPIGGSGPGADLATLQTTMGVYNQVIAAAFSCGVTQCFVYPLPSNLDSYYAEGSSNPPQTFPDAYFNPSTGVSTSTQVSGSSKILNSPDTHQSLYHSHNLPNRQSRLVKAHRFAMQYAFNDLMTKLDAIPGLSGGTMLDQSLLYWAHECPFNTHMQSSYPVILGGGAGGKLNTGKFIDYRNVNVGLSSQNNSRLGVPYNRFMATLLQALGVPPSVYETPASAYAPNGATRSVTINGVAKTEKLTANNMIATTSPIPTTSNGTVPGYGHPFMDQQNIQGGASNTYPYQYQINDMSVPLPVLWKT